MNSSSVNPAPPLPNFFGIRERFRHYSIRQKLIFVILITSLMAILFSTIFFLIFDGIDMRKTTIMRLEVTARLTANNVISPVVFRDAEASRKVLESLAADRHIDHACVRLPDNLILAQYTQNGMTFPESILPGDLNAERFRLTWKTMEIALPLQFDGSNIGTLYIQRETQDLYLRMLTSIAMSLLAAFLSIVLAFWISSHLQKTISDPILDLAITSRKVSQTQDYSIRATATTEDEVSILIGHFNEMLEKIQASDADLRMARDGLEERVQERTVELQHEIEQRKEDAQKIKTLLWHIQEDNEKLLRLDQLKNDFLATVSHELRTPLTSILGFLKLVGGGQAGPLTETQSDFIQTSLSNATRLYGLVNDLLDMTQMESGAMLLKRTKKSARSTMENAAKSVASLASQKQIKINLIAPEKPYEVSIDPEKFERVLINLLSNAIKFTPQKGTIELGVKEETRDEKPGTLFWVKDNGIGIPKEYLERIFDKFYQVENHLTRKVGGTGLGLTITRRILEAHGGIIWAESEVAEGSTFFCFLPNIEPKT